MSRKRVMTVQTLKWLQILFLGVVLAAGMQQARAQMTGDISGDMAIINSALAATLSATGKADAEASRVNMEELYRHWRALRAKNFEAQAADPAFVPRMEEVETLLFAASKLVDSGEFAEAHNALLSAQKLLRPEPAPVDATKPTGG